MQATRRARLQSVIQQELSVVVPRELNDPRIPSVTFTAVEVTADAEQATVYVMVLGSGVQQPENLIEPDPKVTALQQQKMRDALAGLTSAKGFLRRHLAKILDIRHIPDLVFKEDKGLANSTRVHELLKKIGGEGSGPTSS